MKVIITGGTGLIGTALVRELVDSGHRAVVLSRAPANREVPEGAELVEWDGETARGWRDEVEESEAIVNLAGENIAGAGLFPDRWTDRKKEKILQSRLNAGSAVVRAVESAENKPEVVVQASAIGYYGTSQEAKFDEESPPGNGFLPGIAEKWEAATAPVEENGVRRVIVRSGMVLSSDGGVLPRLLFPHRFFLGGPLGSGNQWHSWIHIKDEVRAIRYLLESETAEGPFNLTAPRPLRNEGFEEELGRVLGRPAFFRVPGVLFRVLIGEAATLVLEGQKVVPKKLGETGFDFRYSRLKEALRDLV